MEQELEVIWVKLILKGLRPSGKVSSSLNIEYNQKKESVFFSG